MRLVMTLLVKNERDIVGANIDYHLAHGVDHIVAIDNRSTDGTRDILAGYKQCGVVTLIDEPGQDYSQAQWVTSAALRARDELGADWVLNNDADEFWWSPDGDLKANLTTAGTNSLVCERNNMLCAYDELENGTFFESLVYRVDAPTKFSRPAEIFTGSLKEPYLYLQLPPKVIVKASGLVSVAQGNHSAVHESTLAPQPSGIRIFHYPVRSLNQIERKVREGGAAYARNTNLPVGVGWHWRRWHRKLEREGLEAVLADALPSTEKFRHDLAQGRLVHDATMLPSFRQMMANA